MREQLNLYILWPIPFSLAHIKQNFISVGITFIVYSEPFYFGVFFNLIFITPRLHIGYYKILEHVQ